MKRNFIKNILKRALILGLITLSCLSFSPLKVKAVEYGKNNSYQIEQLNLEFKYNKVGNLYVTNDMRAKLSTKSVIIDYAHRANINGKIDHGADAMYYGNRIYEDDISNRISFKVKKILQQNGVCVFETRDISGYCSLNDRVNMSRNIPHNLYFSLHLNCNDGKPGTGIESYSNSKTRLSNKMVNTLSNKYGLQNRGAKSDPYFTKRIENSILLELGFINNQKDMNTILNNEDKIAQDIAEMIIKDLLN